MLEQIIVAIVQGITEFFPISSDGHILITEWIFNIEPDLFGMIWLHVASLAAILFVYWRDVLHVLHGFLNFVFHKKQKHDFIFAMKLGVATIITAVVAVILIRFISENLESIKLIGGMIMISGLAILLGDQMSKSAKPKSFGWTESVVVGILQGLAALPGISRSGTTTSYLMGAGIERLEALRISFLLAIPAIIGAFIFTSIESGNISKVLSTEYLILFAVTFVVSYVTIRALKKIVQKYWVWFVPYCLLAGSLLVIFG